VPDVISNLVEVRTQDKLCSVFVRNVLDLQTHNKTRGGALISVYKTADLDANTESSCALLERSFPTFENFANMPADDGILKSSAFV
jgi:hypothetical protein